jgi:hypothetical protein
MPRFSIKYLLAVFALAALWLSTIAAYPASGVVQSIVILSILVASAVAAISYDGQQRVFWAVFFLTILMVRIDGKLDIGRGWITSVLNSYGLYQNLPNGYLNYRYMFLQATMQTLAMLLIAALMGLIGVLVYRHCHQTKSE